MDNHAYDGPLSLVVTKIDASTALAGHTLSELPGLVPATFDTDYARAELPEYPNNGPVQLIAKNSNPQIEVQDGPQTRVLTSAPYITHPTQKPH